jgi:hypothetical protein
MTPPERTKETVKAETLNRPMLHMHLENTPATSEAGSKKDKIGRLVVMSISGFSSVHMKGNKEAACVREKGNAKMPTQEHKGVNPR